MTTLSFYARGDGSTANNAALNVENPSQQPTVLITFDSGPTGDIILDYNGGDPDPDTTVTIDGISYNFTVELTGDLPLGSGKVPDALEGLEVTVISVVIDGEVERFFFVTDGSGTQALMQQFGNGAIALDNTDFTPPPVLICFCTGTDILTPSGQRKVEELGPGDLVMTAQGRAVPIQWIGRSRMSAAELQRSPERRPIRIAADAIAPGLPETDLDLSAQHRIVLDGPMTELLTGEARVLVAAKHLLGTIAERLSPQGDVTYFHILLSSHEMLLSNGLVTESLQLSQRNIDGMSPEARTALIDRLSPPVVHAYMNRPDALPSLRKHEGEVLAASLFGAPRGQKHGTTSPSPADGARVW